VTEPLLPTFLLIGAAKAGTTSLFHIMGQHPQVWMSPVKEPHYFSVAEADPADLAFCPGETVTRWPEYLALFQGARPDQARGEASVDYIHTAAVPQRVRERLPGVRLLVMLRHPVDATWSRYWMSRRHGETTRSLEELIASEPLDRPTDLPWGIWADVVVRSSLYATHLRRWIDEVGRDALLIRTADELREAPDAVLRSVFEHIGVDPTVPVDAGRRLNEGYEPRSARLHRWTRWPSARTLTVARAVVPHPVRRWARVRTMQMNERPISPMAPATRQRLLDIYREDTLELEEVLGRDLSAWRR
jgi:hypothetical protein